MRAIEEARRAVFLGGKSARQYVRRRLAAEEGRKRMLFVTGVQRSGTNMLMTLFERAANSDVYHESDPRAFHRYIMRDIETIEDLYRRSNAEVVVVKALHEAQILGELMARFPRCYAVWMYRSYCDVINSEAHQFPGWKNKIDKLVVDRNAADWRGVNMTDETYEIVRAHYRPDISVEDASALFWFYRNRIFFEQGFSENEDICLVKYEEVVERPEVTLPAIYRFAGMAVPGDFHRYVNTRSLRKHPEPALSPSIRELCEDMQATLDAHWHEQELVD